MSKTVIDSGALQMVINALRRDAEQGIAARGEMAAEIQRTATVLDDEIERLSSTRPLVPPGWKLVPAEPTEAMKVAALNDIDPLGKLIDWQNEDGATREVVTECYSAMLAAAPEPPSNAALSGCDTKK